MDLKLIHFQHRFQMILLDFALGFFMTSVNFFELQCKFIVGGRGVQVTKVIWFFVSGTRSAIFWVPKIAEE